MLAPEIEAYYSRWQESSRLSEQEGELERVRTQEILARSLPAAPAEVYDIGGAAGVHAFWLAERGYRVHLIDPVERHIAQAREADSGSRLASISIGDARELRFADRSADAVLLLGPLYHLQDRAERLQALGEARRALKPGGVIVAAAISRFTSLMDGFATGAFADPQFRGIVAADLASGEHRNPSSHLPYFTTAYFHRPEELAEEVRASGFGETRLCAIEGPVWTAPGFRKAWADEEQRARLVEFLRQIESEPSIVGASAHFLAIGRVID